MEQARFFRVTLATCLLLAAGLFAVGTAVERSGSTGHKEPAIESPHEGGGEGATGEGTPSPAGSNNSGERIFGIDRESGPLVALGIAISLALALAVVLTRSAAPLGSRSPWRSPRSTWRRSSIRWVRAEVAWPPSPR